MNLVDGVLAYVVGPGIVTTGTVLTARLAARGSVKAAKVTAEADEETSAVAGYHELVKDLREDVNRLRNDHDSLRKEHEEVRQHVKRLEDQASKDKSLIRHLIGYIRVLRSEIVRLGGHVPDAPADLDEMISSIRY